MIVPKHYEDLHMLHENTMPARSYYIPASRQMDTLVEKREGSDRIQILSGEWKFRYYDSIYDLEEEFYKNGYDDSAYERINVPGVWQMAGYDSHQYTNIRYPFPFDILDMNGYRRLLPLDRRFHKIIPYGFIRTNQQINIAEDTAHTEFIRTAYKF